MQKEFRENEEKTLGHGFTRMGTDKKIIETKGLSFGCICAYLREPVVKLGFGLLTFLTMVTVADSSVWAQPAPPSGLSVATPYDGEVNLIWTPAANATPVVTAYFISRQLLDLTDTPTPTPTGTLSPTPTPMAIATVLPGTPGYQDFQVTNGENYLYQVWGQDQGGMGSSSSVTASPFLAPLAIQPVTVQNIHSNALDLSWGIPNSSYPIAYYRVYLYEYLTATPTPTGTRSPTSTPGSLTPTPTFPQAPVPASVVLSVTPEATVFSNGYTDSTSNSSGAAAFYYVVMAVDNQGHLSGQPTYASSPALPHNMAPPAPPVLSALASLSVTPTILPSGYGARLIWTGSLASEGVTAYQVLQNSTPIATIIYPGPTPTMTYDDTTLPEGNGSSPVTYNVAAMNAYGTSTSASANVAIVAANESTNIQVVPYATANAVSLSWNPAQPGTYGLSGYRLYRGLSGIPIANPSPIPSGSPAATQTPTPFATVVITPSATLTLTAVDAPIPNHMNYWVEPVDLTGHGGTVAGAATPALNLAPTPPSNVGVANPVGNNQIAVSWTAGSAGFFGTTQDYVIYRVVLTNPTPQVVATVPATQLSYTDSVSGSAGTGVGYQIGLTDSMGNISDIASFGNSVNLIGLTAPAVPTVLPLAGSPSSIQFSWLNNPLADSVTSYSVFGPNLPIVTPVATPIATFLATQGPTPTLVFAPPSTTWAASYYYLKAQNSQGISGAATLSGIAVPAYTVTAVIPPGTRQSQVSWNMAPVAPVSGTLTPGVDSYGIYRSLSTSANLTPVAIVPLGTNNYADTLPAATAGVTYYYHVTARAGGAVSQLAESPQVSNPDTYGSVLAWPNPPGGLSPLQAVNQTTLYWAGNNPQEGVTSYSVFWNGSPTPIATVLANLSPTPTYFYTNPESAGNQSSYNVVAYNAAGPSDSSQAVSVLVPPVLVPTISLSPPPTATFVPIATLTPGVWISGLAYSNAVSGYTIYRQSAPTPAISNTPAIGPTYFPMVSLVEGTSTPVYEDSNPIPGYVNNYQVVANNGSSLSAAPTISAQLAVTLWPAAPNPTPMPNATAVTISWAPPIGNVPVSFYDIYRSLYPTTTPVLIATTTPTAVSYVDSGVTTGNAYLYWMDAQNGAGGVSLFSAPATTLPIAAPTLYLTPLPERNQLYWVPISVPTTSPVTGYAVFRAAVTPGATPSFIQVGSIVEPLSNTTVVDSSNVNDGVSYIYQIALATSNNILGQFSNQASVTVFPQPVTNLLAVSGDGLVQLRWNYQGVAANSFFITRALGTAGSAAQTIKTNFQGVNYIDTGVVDKNFYIYNVYTVDALGLTSTVSAAVTALPAAGPALPLVPVPGSGGAVSVAPVTVTQNASNAQTLIGNTLSWGGADQQGAFNPQTMYPLGGYEIYSSTDGGSVYQAVATLPVTLINGFPSPVVGYFDQEALIGGSTYTYLIQAFDAPPNLPVPYAQAVTEGLVHTASYQPVSAFPISPNTALDRNAIRPKSGVANEAVVNIRFVVTSPGNVDIKVYTLDGTYVKELVNQYYPQPGIYWTKWDATNRLGSLVASGVYLITTESPGGHQEFEKVAVIK